jgi:hypothetical protein
MTPEVVDTKKCLSKQLTDSYVSIAECVWEIVQFLNIKCFGKFNLRVKQTAETFHSVFDPESDIKYFGSS